MSIFNRLLNENGYLQLYKKEENDISEKAKDEIAWQYFFNKNPWIFGYGLDYRYQCILQKEFSASDTDAAGKEQVNADFLIGDNYFTTFVELKTPETELFSNRTNRSGSWCLSSKLIYAVSQILEQKAAGQIKLESEPYNSQEEKITQKGYDSKCILVVGNLESEIKNSQDSSKVKEIKKKTFELFRRDSRNIEILTYDELYSRATYICFKEI